MAAAVPIIALLMGVNPATAQQYEEAAQAAQGRAMHDRLEKIIATDSVVRGYLQTGNVATNFSLRFADYNKFSGTFSAKVGGELAEKCSASWHQIGTVGTKAPLGWLQGQLHKAGNLNIESPGTFWLKLSFPTGNPQESKIPGTYDLVCDVMIGGHLGGGYTGKAFLDIGGGSTLSVPPNGNGL